MKHIANSFIIAFSTYSKIPMPQVEWTEKNMNYAICFLPVVGIIIGFIVLASSELCGYLALNNIITAALCSLIPTFITGGIHMDGFCDTCDALASHQSKEKKIAIMKDPHAGAFALIKCSCYYLLYFAMFTQISQTGLFVLVGFYSISRTLTALSVVTFKSAKTSGLAVQFKEAAHKKTVIIILTISLILLAGITIYIDYVIGIVGLVTACIVFIYYKNMAYKQFGGTTGDVAGYFLSLCELWIAIAVVITERISMV